MIERLDKWISAFLREGAEFVTFSDFIQTLPNHG